MIKHLPSEQIDHEKWDNCINNSYNGIIYAKSWYLNIVHPDWEALVEGNYMRIMPLTITKKFGISYFMQPFFIQQLGIFSQSKMYPEKTLEFIKAIPKKIKYIDTNLNSYNQLTTNTFSKENENYMLDLIEEYSKIRANYSSNNIRNLKKANKHKLSIIKSVKPNEIINLFNTNKGKDVTKWTDVNYKTLERLMYMAIHKGMGVVYGVYTENNQLCAAAFFTRFNKRMIFLFSGSNQTAKQNGAMSFLIDSVIKEHSSSQTTLDFEGSNDKNLARFYKGFGAKKVAYNRIKINRMLFPFSSLLNYYLKQKEG